MIVSTNLCSTPFLGHTDNTRLQMSAKQLTQSVTNPSCEIPKVIGEEYRYLGDSSRWFKVSAPCSGKVIYCNNEILVVIFDDPDIGFEIFDISPVTQCSGLYASQLRYRREVGPFKTGDILYEYDCFKHGIPTYGYNLFNAYLPFFAFNHEDAMVLSESAANKCCSTKMEQIQIPIYTYSLFKNIYNNDLGFLPNIGEQINGSIVTYKSQLKDKRNPYQSLKAMNITDFTSVIDNSLEFNSTPVYSRIPNARVLDLRVHAINKQQLVDKQLMCRLGKIRKKYSDYLTTVHKQLSQFLPQELTRQSLIKNYVLNVHSVKAFKEFDIKNLSYIVELTLAGESKTKVGDKFANRYAAKGLISLILPDELRPYTQTHGIPVDSFTGPISVISRMNFGQIVEGIISKIIMKAEGTMLSSTSQDEVANELKLLSKLANIMNQPKYEHQIRELALNVQSDSDIYHQFKSSINEIGLYYEAPNFANFDIKDIEEFGRNYGVPCNENVILPRETIRYMNQKLNIDMPLPHKDLVLKDVFASWIYTVKLKQEAASRITSRDFGTYKSTTKQPAKGRNKDGLIGGSSRLGHMELNCSSFIQ